MKSLRRVRIDPEIKEAGRKLEDFIDEINTNGIYDELEIDIIKNGLWGGVLINVFRVRDDEVKSLNMFEYEERVSLSVFKTEEEWRLEQTKRIRTIQTYLEWLIGVEEARVRSMAV